MEFRRKRLLARRGMMCVLIALAVYIGGNRQLPSLVNTNADDTAPYQTFYDDATCITEQSNNTCSFPLLTDHHDRCGYFAGSTSWQNIKAYFPGASMSAELCRLLPVTSAPQRLREYISERNISTIVLFGDSQGTRYKAVLLRLFREAAFGCKLLKSEPAGRYIHLNYYTEGSLFMPNDTVLRSCWSCNSERRVCSDSGGHSVSVEYVSMIMATSTPLGGHCNDSHHPLCRNTTQQEYVLKHYLRRENNYPQLLLFFSTFGHDRSKVLTRTYDGIRHLHGLITSHVPASSTVIWYNVPGLHERNHRRWYTSEGAGFSPNDKLQALNHFLSKLQIVHHKSGNAPAMYSFFDLYHMQEQLRGAWAADHVHSKMAWYSYVIGYTATMLPSLPLP